jgi:hypothetical protein
MKFFKQQSGDGPNFLGADHFVSLTGSHGNLTPTGWGSSNSLPNPISSNMNPEPVSQREYGRALPTSSTISFWSQTAPRDGKSVEDEDLRRLTRYGVRYRPPTSHCPPPLLSQFCSRLKCPPTSSFHLLFFDILDGCSPSTRRETRVGKRCLVANSIIWEDHTSS